MNETTQPAVAGPVEPTVRPGLPVIGCVWGGMVWLVSLRSPKKLDLGARLYSEAELDAAVAAERERCANAVRDHLRDDGIQDNAPLTNALSVILRA